MATTNGNGPQRPGGEFGQSQPLQSDRSAAFAALSRSIGEYQNAPHTPERVTNTWKSVWAAWGEKSGTPVKVPSLDKSAEEIAELEQRGRMLVYIPESFSRPDALSARQRLFPEQFVCHWAGENPTVTIENLLEQHGWLAIEKSPRLVEQRPERDAPPTHSAKVRENALNSNRLRPQTFNTYLIGSLFSELTEGHFFDEENYLFMGEKEPSLILGSTMKFPHERNGYRFYVSALMGQNAKSSLNRIETAYWGGPTNYDAVRTVEASKSSKPRRA